MSLERVFELMPPPASPICAATPEMKAVIQGDGLFYPDELWDFFSHYGCGLIDNEYLFINPEARFHQKASPSIRSLTVHEIMDA